MERRSFKADSTLIGSNGPQYPCGNSFHTAPLNESYGPEEALQRVLERWQEKKATAVEWLQKELGCTAKFAAAAQAKLARY